MKHVLITGADGYVGHRLARRLLADTDARLTLQLRAADANAAQAKVARMTELLGHAPSSRIAYVHGDLTDDAPLAGADANTVDTIVHSAAVTRFNVEKDLAQRVNIDGTAKVLAFARTCPKLDSFNLLSTVYTSGLAAGNVPEVPMTGAVAFANFYEWSKNQAEQLVLDASDVPSRILRTATVIADDDDGNVTQLNAVHNTLKLYYYGLLSLLPGDADTPVYVVTGDFVTDAVYAAIAPGVAQGIYHIAHTRDESPTLDALLSEAFDTFEQREGFKRRNVLRPVYTDRDSFGLLTDAVKGFGGGVVTQALGSMSPFARQLYVAKSVQNERLRAIYPAYAAPDALALVRNACNYLIDSGWGKRSIARAAA